MTDVLSSDLFYYRPITNGLRREYEENGYLLLGRTLTDRGLELMRRQCMEAWEIEHGAYEPKGTWLQNALLTNIHRYSAVVRRYFFEGPLVDIAEKFISRNIKATSSQLTFKLKGNTQTFAWHQDTGYGQLDPDNSMTCLTALDNTDQTNGCLWIVPKSHLQRIEVTYTNEDKVSKKEISLEVDESDAMPVALKAGECLVFHNWMLHKSDGNRSGRDRRVLFVRYADADAVEVYNDRKPRLGRLLRGQTKFDEVAAYEAELK